MTPVLGSVLTPQDTTRVLSLPAMTTKPSSFARRTAEGGCPHMSIARAGTMPIRVRANRRYRDANAVPRTIV